MCCKNYKKFNNATLAMSIRIEVFMILILLWNCFSRLLCSQSVKGYNVQTDNGEKNQRAAGKEN